MKLESISIKDIVVLITGIAPLWALIVFGFNYEQNLVKRAEIEDMVVQKQLAAKDLDARIERTEILIAIFARDIDNLTEKDKNDYERAKARLINLEEQRDKAIGEAQ